MSAPSTRWTRLLRWPLSPLGFAVCMVAAWMLWVIAPGWRHDGWGATPIGEWTLGDPRSPWQHDPLKGTFTYTGGLLPVDRSPGVSIRFDEAAGGSMQVGIYWHRFGGGHWSGGDFPHPLGHTWQYFDLAAYPPWNGQVYELTIKTYAPVRAITLESRGAFAELSRAWRAFTVAEILDEPSMNFLRAPQFHGIDWTVLLATTCLLYVLVQIAVAGMRRRRLDWPALVAFALGAWVLADLRFSVDLAVNARGDAHRFPQIADADAVLHAERPDYAALAATVKQLVPPDAVMTLLTDSSTHLNKAQYLYAPRVVENWQAWVFRRPEYVVTFAARDARYDPVGQRLTVLGSVALPARLLAQVGSGYIFAVAPDQDHQEQPTPP